jgi:hypothetical protein
VEQLNRQFAASLASIRPYAAAAMVIGDLLAALGIVICIPVVILAIGIPVALCVRFLLWIAGML